MATPLTAHPAVDTTSENIENQPRESHLTRRLLIAMSTAVALQMSPGFAQTESGRILQSGELPKVENVKKGDTHTDKKPSMDGKKTWVVTSTVQMVDTPYGKLSFAEIQKHEKKDEILEGLKPSKQAAFNEWEIKVEHLNNEGKRTELIAKKEELGKLEIELIIEKKEGKRLEGELIKTYYAYVANIEAGAAGERAVLEKILGKEFTPPDLKQRVENLLSRKDIKLALK